MEATRQSNHGDGVAQTTCFERMHQSARSREEARRKFRVETMLDILLGMAAGCFLGLLFTPPLCGALAGAIVGTYMALRRTHYSRFTVIATAVDSRRRTAACYAASAKFGALVEDANRELVRYPEHDEPGMPGSEWRPETPLSDVPEQLRVEPRRRKILDLAEHRRWVADLGCVSRLGSPILNLVGSLRVVGLLAAGKTVYLVCGETPTYEKHLAGIFSSNLSQSMVYLRAVEWVVCRFEYRLEPVADPSHLDRVFPVGEGVPQGLISLERDAAYCDRVVARQETVRIEESHVANRLLRVHRESSRRYSNKQMSRLGDLKMSTNLLQLVKSPFPDLPGIFGITGAIVGAIASGLAEMDDAQSLVAIACGGFVGTLVGDLALTGAIWRTLK